MRALGGLLLGLLFAVSASANPLLGAWKSDRALTLQRLDIDKVRPEARKFVVEKVDLGNAVVEYTPIYEGGFYEVFRRVPPAKQAGR
jgi:hypothetical protein